VSRASAASGGTVAADLGHYDSGMATVAAVIAVVLLAATYLAWTAGRVDRLHARAAAATRALDAHLLRRAAAAAVLAEELPAGELYAAARAALDAQPDGREAAENDLTRQLRTLPLDPADRAADAVVAASRRVAVARQVHTDLVRDALAARRRPLVRLLRLTRAHPRPAYFDIGDPTLERPRIVALPPGQASRAALPATAVPAVSGATDQATAG
jgi:hypothetical protein